MGHMTYLIVESRSAQPSYTQICRYSQYAFKKLETYFFFYCFISI
jgi:hypothetical protein